LGRFFLKIPKSDPIASRTPLDRRSPTVTFLAFSTVCCSALPCRPPKYRSDRFFGSTLSSLYIFLPSAGVAPLFFPISHYLLLFTKSPCPTSNPPASSLRKTLEPVHPSLIALARCCCSSFFPDLSLSAPFHQVSLPRLRPTCFISSEDVGASASFPHCLGSQPVLLAHSLLIVDLSLLLSMFHFHDIPVFGS
jgi:hypothetical protein